MRPVGLEPIGIGGDLGIASTATNPGQVTGFRVLEAERF
jgi:hypothetical protein